MRDKKMRRHKFNATRCELDGLKFASKLERDYYAHLKLLEKAGEVLFFLSQVPLRLSGNTKYIIDFMVFYTNGDIEFIEIKGFMTDLAKLKIKQAEDLYPIKIKIIKDGGFKCR
jgi:Protein of unknown function (DUF1064)